MNYTTMMIDIIESKKINKKNRAELQIFIKKLLSALNQIFEPALEFEVIFSAGDEFQGLFKYPQAAVLYYRLLSFMLAPLPIRCGIGYGKLDIRIIDGTSSEQDGPTYHYAREAIQLTQDKKEYTILFNSKNRKDNYLNTLLNARNLIIQQQSNTQKTIQLIYELMVPIIDDKLMDYNKIKEMYKLLEVRNILIGEEIVSNTKYLDYEMIPIYIDKNINIDESMIIEATKAKGISSVLGSITNTTRQNVENIIKKANITYIRNIDLAIILYIKENYRGEL